MLEKDYIIFQDSANSSWQIQKEKLAALNPVRTLSSPAFIHASWIIKIGIVPKRSTARPAKLNFNVF